MAEENCYLVQEIDGVSRFTLEDSSGFLLLETCEEPPVEGPPLGMGDRRLYHERIRRHPVSEDEMWIITTILSES
jgi:hypothetical protein